MRYTIVGASGNTGRQITQTLLANAHHVRAVARHADKLQDLVAAGAEAWIGDVEDAGFLTRAFTGVDAVYTLIPPAFDTNRFRALQNKRGEAIAGAIRRSGVRHVVSLSSLGADLPEGTGVVLGLYDQEQRLNQLDGVNVLHLRAAYFMENLFGNIGVIKQMGIHGSALAPDVAFPLVTTPDIAQVAAARLMKLDFSGKEVQEVSGARDYTITEVTSILGSAIGIPDLSYQQFPYEAVAQAMQGFGFSADTAANMMELNKCMNAGLVKHHRTPASTTPTTIEAFAPIFAAVYNAG